MTDQPTPKRGPQRLLWDCATVGRSLEIDLLPARSRIVAELGEDLTQVLLTTLQETKPSATDEQNLKHAS